MGAETSPATKAVTHPLFRISAEHKYNAVIDFDLISAEFGGYAHKNTRGDKNMATAPNPSLSVGGSIAGLLALAGTIDARLSRFDTEELAMQIVTEMRSLAGVLGLLRQLVSNPSGSGMALVKVELLVVVLTGCVVVVAELEAELKEQEEDGPWKCGPAQEERLRTLVDKLAVHRASLNLMLTVLQWYVCMGIKNAAAWLTAR